MSKRWAKNRSCRIFWESFLTGNWVCWRQLGAWWASSLSCAKGPWGRNCEQHLLPLLALLASNVHYQWSILAGHVGACCLLLCKALSNVWRAHSLGGRSFITPAHKQKPVRAEKGVASKLVVTIISWLSTHLFTVDKSQNHTIQLALNQQQGIEKKTITVWNTALNGCLVLMKVRTCRRQLLSLENKTN